MCVCVVCCIPRWSWRLCVEDPKKLCSPVNTCCRSGRAFTTLPTPGTHTLPPDKDTTISTNNNNNNGNSDDRIYKMQTGKTRISSTPRCKMDDKPDTRWLKPSCNRRWSQIFVNVISSGRWFQIHGASHLTSAASLSLNFGSRGSKDRWNVQVIHKYYKTRSLWLEGRIGVMCSSKTSKCPQKTSLLYVSPSQT